MNVGDLLDARVLGPDGAALGVVVDVRLALEVVDEPEGGPGAGDPGAPAAAAGGSSFTPTPRRVCR